METRPVQLSLLALALTTIAALVPGSLRAQSLEFLLAWGSSGSAPGQFYGVLGVAVAPNGNVYATDAGNNRIQVFTNTGEFVAQWGSTGTGNVQFNRPMESPSMRVATCTWRTTRMTAC